MLKSNRWIIGTILLVMLYITAHFAALRLMHHFGWGGKKHSEHNVDTTEINPGFIKVIYITGCNNVQAVMSDSFRCVVYDKDSQHFRYNINGDTIRISGDTLITDTIYYENHTFKLDTNLTYFSNIVKLYITGHENIVLLRGNLTIDYSDLAGQYNIILQSASLNIRTLSLVDSIITNHIRQLNLQLCNKASINNVMYGVAIENADIVLSNGGQLDGSILSNIKRCKITYSDSAHINGIKGYHLQQFKWVYRPYSTRIPYVYEHYSDNIYELINY